MKERDYTGVPRRPEAAAYWHYREIVPDDRIRSALELEIHRVRPRWSGNCFIYASINDMNVMVFDHNGMMLNHYDLNSQRKGFQGDRSEFDVWIFENIVDRFNIGVKVAKQLMGDALKGATLIYQEDLKNFLSVYHYSRAFLEWLLQEAIYARKIFDGTGFISGAELSESIIILQQAFAEMEPETVDERFEL